MFFSGMVLVHFFKRKQKRCPDRLIKKKFYKKWVATKPTKNTQAYSPSNNSPNRYSPASTHKQAFLLMFSKITKEGQTYS
jgi:hypothetical protein